jgi:hypothetical protein
VRNEISVGKRKKKRLLERLRRRWEDKIKRDREYEAVDWIHLAQARVLLWNIVSTVMILRVQLKVGDFLTI